MHASAMAADPAIIYWNPATLAAIARVRALRARGTPAFFTIDAGPHVKALCARRRRRRGRRGAARASRASATLIAAPGPGRARRGGT